MVLCILQNEPDVFTMKARRKMLQLRELSPLKRASANSLPSLGNLYDP